MLVTHAGEKQNRGPINIGVVGHPDVTRRFCTILNPEQNRDYRVHLYNRQPENLPSAAFKRAGLDVVAVDCITNVSQGREFLEQLKHRADDNHTSVPSIVLVNDQIIGQELVDPANHTYYQLPLNLPGLTDRTVMKYIRDTLHCYASETIDQATGLYNKSTYFNELNRWIIATDRKEQRKLIIGLIDLDGFGLINKRYGQQTGDKALKTLGTRLKQSYRAIDIAARLGGDEFGLICPSETNGHDSTGAATSPDSAQDADCERVAERTMNTIRDVKLSVVIDQTVNEFSLSSSLGLVAYRGGMRQARAITGVFGREITPEETSDCIYKAMCQLLITSKKGGKARATIMPSAELINFITQNCRDLLLPS